MSCPVLYLLLPGGTDCDHHTSTGRGKSLPLNVIHEETQNVTSNSTLIQFNELRHTFTDLASKASQKVHL